MKDLGDLHYFLSIQVTHTSAGIFLSQQKYVTDLLHKFHLHTTKPGTTPSVPSTTLSPTDA